MKIKNHIPAVLAIFFLLAAWQLVAMSVGYPAIFPTLPDLLIESSKLFLSKELYVALSATIIRGIIGFFIAFTLAFIFATIATFSTFWKNFFHPIVVTIRSVPVISIVLITMLWLSPPQLPVFIALLTMFPILFQNILNGLELTDKKLVEMARSFGKPASERFLSVYLPSAKEVIFGGISTAMGFGWRSIIIGEAISQPLHGLGASMKQAQVFINVSELIAWTAIAVLVSYFFETIIRQLKRLHITRYYKPDKNQNLKQIEKEPERKTITINDLNKKFNQTIIFKAYSRSFTSDTVSCIKSPSGKGKTTLLRLIAGIEKMDSGKINFSGYYSVGFAFQDDRLLPWLNVEENIAFGIKAHPSQKKHVANRIALLIDKLELSGMEHKYPHELSGGQQQRTGLARALIGRSDILLLDEPLNGQDEALKQRIMDFLNDWISIYQPIVIWATHENIRLSTLPTEEINL